MSPFNPKHVQYVSDILQNSSYPQLLSMRLVKMDSEETVIETIIEAKHLQLHGVVHGGVYASLIDTAAFWSVYFDSEAPDVWYTTFDLNVKYLKSVSSGRVITRGKKIKIGKRLLYAEARIFDDTGNLLAHGTSSLIYLSQSKWIPSDDIPLKFL